MGADVGEPGHPTLSQVWVEERVLRGRRHAAAQGEVKRGHLGGPGRRPVWLEHRSGAGPGMAVAHWEAGHTARQIKGCCSPQYTHGQEPEPRPPPGLSSHFGLACMLLWVWGRQVGSGEPTWISPAARPQWGCNEGSGQGPCSHVRQFPNPPEGCGPSVLCGCAERVPQPRTIP